MISLENGSSSEVESGRVSNGAQADVGEPLIALDGFTRMLAEAETLDEVTDIRSRAEAIRSWAKNVALSLEMQNRAAELKLRAERKAGQLLTELKLRGGSRKLNGCESRLRLSDLGISQKPLEALAEGGSDFGSRLPELSQPHL